jgi:hypothetical protein
MNLDELLNEREIMRNLAQFARIADTKAWDRLGEVFAPNVSYDYGRGYVGQGIEILTEHMRGFLDLCGGTQHLLGNVTIDVDGRRAVSRAYVQARHQRVDDQGGAVFDSNGEYVDQWEKRADGWRIVHRDATWFTYSGDPAIIAAEL